ncbi:unnamed protein product, partial [marine sediment metagenome]
GHPQMGDYKDWVDKIFRELSISFDSQKHLERAREDYAFYKDLDLKSTDATKEDYSKYQKWFQELKKHNSHQFNRKTELP